MCNKSIFQVVPFAWVLMSSRTTTAYNAVFEGLKEINPNYSPSVVMCDYERALQKSLKESFPDVKVFGCFFHFAQVGITILTIYCYQSTLCLTYEGAFWYTRRKILQSLQNFLRGKLRKLQLKKPQFVNEVNEQMKLFLLL